MKNTEKVLKSYEKYGKVLKSSENYGKSSKKYWKSSKKFIYNFKRTYIVTNFVLQSVDV